MMHVPSSREECLATANQAPWTNEWVVSASINRSLLQALWQSILLVHRFVHHPCSSSVEDTCLQGVFLAANPFAFDGYKGYKASLRICVWQVLSRNVWGLAHTLLLADKAGDAKQRQWRRRR